ncbi:MAG: DUF6783 domain-containing protein [Lachnospiraceae bacterium]
MFYPHSVAVARYAALIRIKSPTNWDSQLTKSLFQTRSKCHGMKKYGRNFGRKIWRTKRKNCRRITNRIRGCSWRIWCLQ